MPEKQTNRRPRSQPALLFDLDGTLIDSVYQHVLAWREALEHVGIKIPCWMVHRRIGMSGGLIVHAFTRDTGHSLTPDQVVQAHRLHAEGYLARSGQVRTLPGARELLTELSRLHVPWAIATSGKREAAQGLLDMLEIGPEVPVITRDEVSHAKPDPDLFLAASERLGTDIGDCVVIGDSVWDLLAAQRARALGVGLLSGGFGEEELMQAGAYRVYRDPADLLTHLEEIGIRIQDEE
jgi:HAD superfamily hydrolase (TIGR01509 family)